MKGETIRESVLRRPGMYLGEVDGGFAANAVIGELVANSIDQFLLGKLTKIDIEVENHRIRIKDDGPGLPFQDVSDEYSNLSKIEAFLLYPHFGPTADGHTPHVHFRFLGVGLAIVNVACSRLEIKTYDGKRSWKRTFVEGSPVGIPIAESSESDSGTEFSLILENKIFGAHTPDLDALKAELTEHAHLYPGLKISLNGKELNGGGGLLDYGFKLYPDERKNNGFSYIGTHNGLQLHVALIGQSEIEYALHSWANGVRTDWGGSHVDGLHAALADINWKPAVRLIHIVIEQPEFTGPLRSCLRVPKLADKIREVLNSPLKAFYL